jgi:CheY-like chemotaxis protein
MGQAIVIVRGKRRKILVVGEVPSARDDVRILLGSVGYECSIASNAQQALAMVKQKDFDAVIFDPQRSSLPAAQVISRISQIRPTLLGRILIITGEGSDSETRDLGGCPSIPRKQLLQRLWVSVESLFRPEKGFGQVTHVGRLSFDSIRQRLPAEVRASHARSRRLLYKYGSLEVDLQIEPRGGFNSLALAGQILDSARVDRKFDSVPVVLHGRKRVVAQTTANQFGEFVLDFRLESTLRLEIGISETQRLSVALPNLEWGARGASGEEARL